MYITNIRNTNLVVAFLLFSLTILGHFFADSNILASLMWPAFGVSAIFYYYYDKRVLVGITIGIFTGQMFNELILEGSIGFIDVVMRISFTATSILEVVIFKAFLKKFQIHLKPLLLSLLIFFIAGVISTLTGGFFITSILFLLFKGDIEFMYIVFRWMIGDLTGLVLFGSIVYFILHNKEKIAFNTSSIVFHTSYVAFSLILFLEIIPGFTYQSFNYSFFIFFVLSAVLFNYSNTFILALEFLVIYQFVYVRYTLENYDVDTISNILLELNILLLILIFTNLILKNYYDKTKTSSQLLKNKSIRLEKLMDSTIEYFTLGAELATENRIINEKYLRSVFSVATNIFDFADKASCYIIENGNVRWIDSIGYDLDVLNKLEIDLNTFYVDVNKALYLVDLSEMSNTIGLNAIEFSFKSSDIRESIVIGFQMIDGIIGGISIDLCYDTHRSFKESDIVAFQSFQQSINQFYEKSSLFLKNQELQKLSQEYLNIAGVLIVALDKEGNITLINDTGCKILESSREDLINKNWFENFLPDTNREIVLEAFHNFFKDNEGLNSEYENVIITATGKELLFSWRNTFLYDKNGKLESILSSGQDITDMKRKEEELFYMSYHDSLTGLYNRRYYIEKLPELDIPENYPLTIVMSDINGLKLINDAFGHSSGDELLKAAADLIKESSKNTDLVARIGGDEFVIVMPKTTSVEAEQMIDRINNKSKSITVDSISLSISSGHRTKVSDLEDIQEMSRAAEDLMYRVKLNEIPSMRSSAIDTILSTLHEKDTSSEIHSRTVSIISEQLAKAHGLSSQEVNEIKTAGLLHDIGKIIIPISIISKKGSLTTEEYELIKGHPEIGFRILNSLHDMREISKIVLCHHERWDGFGYPRGIKEEDIPLQSRIIAIADAFDAMTSKRTYKATITYEQALQEIIDNAGTQFDPKLASVFEKNYNKIISKLRKEQK